MRSQNKSLATTFLRAVSVLSVGLGLSQVAGQSITIGPYIQNPAKKAA